MRYFTSDTHFWHKAIIGYDERPYSSLEEMEESIIRNWNNTVSKKDIVYHLGDFAFGNPRKWANITRRLNGSITLVRGNHDLQNGATLRRLVADGEPIFNDVCDFESIKINGMGVILSHYPYIGTEYDYRMKEYAPNNTGLWLLHGHTHKAGHGPVNLDRVNINLKMINVGCMMWDYTPVSEHEIYRIIKED
jgi:calcineurin-like phosphoesterase family protein